MFDRLIENESIINLIFMAYIVAGLLFDLNRIKSVTIRNISCSIFAICYILLTVNVIINGLIKGF